MGGSGFNCPLNQSIELDFVAMFGDIHRVSDLSGFMYEHSAWIPAWDA